jgi:eukaryotic-like serine/threonine-protein kinase
LIVEGVQPQAFGKYTVYELIGKGGMASVHRAERVGRDGVTRQIALKRLLPMVAAQREMRRDFLDEGKLTRILHHPNIAETYDSGTYRETAFIAMEYLPGPTLKQLVQHCAAATITIPPPIALNVALQMCEALDYAHNAVDDQGNVLGIIHRDVSPSNVILYEAGLVKLIDFGLAKARLGVDRETAVGMIKGKYNYVAPEYLDGHLDARVDLWAVGVVMYEMLTCRRLFDGFDDIETISRVRKLPIPRASLVNPRVTSDVDSLVIKALQRDPNYRFRSAAAMREALEEVIAKPGNRVSNEHVITWTRWALAQQGRSEASGMASLLAITAPPLPPPSAAEEFNDDPTQPEIPRHHRRLLWPIIGLVAIVLLLELLLN